jgi:hypothetical protein
MMSQFREGFQERNDPKCIGGIENLRFIRESMRKGGLRGFLEEMPGIQCRLSSDAYDIYSINTVPLLPHIKRPKA